MEQLIKAENLRVSFGSKQVVGGVSLELYAGEFLALVGESGSGKTLLCRSLLALAPKGARVEYDTLLTPQPAQMSLIMQNAMTALNPAVKVGKQIMEANRACPPSPVELLSRVKIDNPALRARQYPDEFSGGMRQRVAAAIALAMKPKIIFADEPTTSLDYEAQKKIMELLNQIKQAGTAIFFVTHDLSLAQAYADRILIMKEGLIVEEGKTKDIFANPRRDYTRELIHYALASANPPQNLPQSKVDEQPLIEAIDLKKSYPLGYGKINRVLNNVNVAIYPRQITGLWGASGIGKSTLGRCLAGLEKPSGGKLVKNADINVQMIFQDSASALSPRLTVEQIIAEPLLLRDKKQPPRKYILELMNRVELEEELISRRPGQLSGGQRQRVAIARAIAAKPDFIIADEAVSSLDVTTCGKIINLLKRLQQEEGLAMLLISHDVNMLKRVCDKIISM